MSAAISTERLQKLRTTLARETAKGDFANKVVHAVSPSKFRSCALDTHDSLPPHDHRATPASSYKRTPPPHCHAKMDAAAYLQRALGPVESMPLTDSTGQLAERSKALQTSDWALLDTLEAHLCIEARERHAQLKEQTCQQTRLFLDGQMQDAAEAQRQQQQQRQRDAEMMQRAVRQHEATEAQRAAAKRRQQQEMKRSAAQQVQAHRGKQAAQERRKVEDEEAELRETQRLLDVDRRAAEAAKQAVAQEHERVQAENAARIAAKHAAAAREKAEDKALMEETIRTLEKQAANRAQATKDFHDEIERRGNRAGVQVVREAAQLAEREERVARAAEEQKAREDATKVLREAAARKKAREEIDASRAVQLALKAQQHQQGKAEAIQFVEEVKAKDLHSRSVQKAEDVARRLAAIENQRVLREQAAEKAQRDMFGDVNMTGREREFMRPVLSQAHISVGRPHAIAVNRPW